jgi:prophage regulatory protein
MQEDSAAKPPKPERSITTVGKLVTMRELKSIYGNPYCFEHPTRLEEARLFPVRVWFSANRVAWYADEVEAWVSSCPRG